jgi:glycosyltransferase involved in cell wall biosynthesis
VTGVGTSGSVPLSGPSCHRPRVSVLVGTHGGGQRLRGCLDSLVAQTLPRDEFEILVIHNDSTATIPDVVQDFRTAHPSPRTRVIEFRGQAGRTGRQIGVNSARGEYVIFLDDHDLVSPPFLDSLLRAAGPDILPIAMIEDTSAGARAGARMEGRRGLLAVRDLDAHALVTAFSENSAKLVPTDLARSVCQDAGLGSGDIHAFWLELLARRPFRFWVLPADHDGVYRRTVRESGDPGQEPSYDRDVVQRLECLRAIEAVDRSDPTVRYAAGELMLHQASMLNAHLREHPLDHAPLVRDARAKGLREIPWRAVNAGLARDLAICYCFPPDLDTSGMVAARRLRERGVVVDVISQDLSTLRSVDPQSLRVVDEVLDRTHVVSGGASFVRWSAMTAFAEEAWSTVEAWEATKGRYASLYSRAMAPTSHFAAALVKLRRPDVEWIAEFSDPLRINAVGEERAGAVDDDWLSRELRAGLDEAGFMPPERLTVFDFAERLAYALADRIVFTNEHQKEYMLGYCADPRLSDRVRKVAEVSHHPTLPADFYALASTDLRLDPTKVHIAYFGVFYSTRGLGEVFEALSSLGHVERDQFRLHVFTPNPDAVTLEVVRSGLAGVVEALGFVGFLEFLHLTTKFDVLLVNDAATTGHSSVNPYLPSKVSDYLGSGTPVWAVYEDGSVLSTMTFEYRSPLGDVAAALEVLRRMLARGVPRSTAG